MRALNAEIAADASGELPRQLARAHRGHAAARREVVGDRAAVALAACSEEAGLIARTALHSGIAGQSPRKSDVKCLHAQAADALCRPGRNHIGEQLVLLRLQHARGVAVRGAGAACCEQCNPRVPAEQAGWWYTPAKNRWKLRKRLMRRKAKAAAA